MEQTNLASASSSRRSEAYDRPSSAAHPPRMDSRKDGSGHGRTSSRYANQAGAAHSNSATAATEHSRSSTSTRNPPTLRRRTEIEAATGVWELGKTIGAGSMGKVKLARNKQTGEQVAVKIVPRQSTEGEHRTHAERERADHSKEIRTAREAAIVTLVNHPFICGMRDVVRTNYHWYMLFEYVNGGQMLDYIISHGRLKEKQARKFGRQIASALDYCHRNSIVHRDLKIENILISKTGDIKIIDFGLSNLFSPKHHLKTFCGSLYFAAPELLQAKQYIGPEVDVWSFGIVLYVLVCGKVPFDDQSMPQLHAKIKKGHVEYPPWISPGEYAQGIGRNHVTNAIAECKNLISRMLTTTPSERASLNEIMRHPWMTKGFGHPPENMLGERKPLELPLDPAVIDKMTGFDFGNAEYITRELTKVIESEDFQPAIRNAERNAERRAERRPQQPVHTEHEKKRGVFDFYKRRSSINSRDTLNAPSNETVQLGQDATNAYHPLISVYYLAREKQEREQTQPNPGGLSIPKVADDTDLNVPRMPEAPAAAYTNAHTAEMAGEKPTGGRSRPRARTRGEDEIADGVQNLNIGTAPNPTIVEPGHQAPKRESAAAGLLRKLSTRKHREPLERPERAEKASHPPPALGNYRRAESSNRNLTVNKRDASVTRTEAGNPRPVSGGHGDRLMPPPAGDGVSDGSSAAEPQQMGRKHGLGRSISVNSSDIRRRLTRRGASEGSSTRPLVRQMAASAGTDRKQSLEQQAAASDVERPSARPAAGAASRARSLGHSRKESMQARRLRREAARTSDVPEEADLELQDEAEAGASADQSPTGMKPVYLKGLFSVKTTSSRPLPVIRADIIRVLKQLGVEYKEIKGGFTCRHAPSIKAPTNEAAPSGAMPASSNSESHPTKLSFGRLRNNERDDARASPRAKRSSRQHPSYVNNSSQEEANNTDTLSDEENKPPSQSLSPRSNYAAGRAAGETSTHVQSDLGGSMSLRFEIFIVKVPLLSLHGIQFKKVDGGTWQYKNMAQTILNDLRL